MAWTFTGKKCLVIGNGVMGKLAATMLLAEEGADVTVTVRQYRSGIVEIPLGCKRIDYGARMEFVSKVRLCRSVRRSARIITVTKELVAQAYAKEVR